MIITMMISLLLLGSIVSKIELYSDDFFYKTFLNGSFNNFITQNIKHYENTNGRVLVHTVDELLLHTPTFVYYLVLVLCLFVIFYFSAKIILPKEYDSKNSNITFLAVSLTLVLMISNNILKETAFWITGFSNYILPLAIVMLAFYQIKKMMDTHQFNFWGVVLAFLAGASTEQGFMLILILSLTYFIMERITLKNIHLQGVKVFIVMVFSEVLGFLTIFLSPASRARTLGTPTIFNTSIPDLFTLNFAAFSNRLVGKEGGYLIVSILILMIASFAYHHKELNRGLMVGFFISLGIILYDTLVTETSTVTIVFAIIVMAYILFAIIEFAKKPEFHSLALFLIAASFVQAGMYALGEYSYRSFFILSVICIMLIATVLTEFIVKLKHKRYSIVLVCMMILLEVCVAFPIYQGYSYNKTLFDKMRESIQNYERTKFIEIDMNVDKRYAHTMGYENGSFLDYFYGEYGITEEVEPNVYYIMDDAHKIYIGNQLLNYPLYTSESGFVYVPARLLVETLGGTCEWNPESTTYSYHDYMLVVDNITGQIISCSNEEYIGVSLHEYFESYMGRRYIKLSGIKYLIGMDINDIEMKIGDSPAFAEIS